MGIGGLVVVVPAQVRRRATGLAGVALLTALVVGVTLTGLASARRTASSLDRALDEAGVADVSVDVAVADPHTAARVARLPEVAAASTSVFAAVTPEGTDLVGGIDLAGVATLGGSDPDRLDRPRVLQGRLPAPDRADEVLLNRWLAGTLEVAPGDQLTLLAYRSDQVGDIFGGAGPVEPAGARLPVTVVGVGEPLDALVGGEVPFGIVLFSPAFWKDHGPSSIDASQLGDLDVGIFRLLLRARLHHGAADEPAYLRGLEGIYGGAIDTTFSEDRPDVFASASESVRVAAVALAVSALAMAVAGLVVVGQAIARDVREATAADGASLRAVGLTRAELAVVTALPDLAAVVVGALVGVGAATLASDWLPPGVVSFLEPRPGRRIDALVLGAGGIGLAVVLIAGALVAAWRAGGPDRGRRARVGYLPSLVAGPTGAMALGLTRGGAQGRGAARPASLVTIGAVIGAVAALVFGASLDHLDRTSALWGAPWDAQVLLQTDGPAISEREGPGLAADPAVDALSRIGVFETPVDGAESPVRGAALDRLKGDVAPTVLTGRLPLAADEIAIDARAVPGPGPEVGDTLVVGNPAAPTPLTVVGHLAVPAVGSLVVTGEALEAIGTETSDIAFLVRWAPGQEEAGWSRLRETFAQVAAPTAPGAVDNLARVRSYPRALTALMTLLLVASVAHLGITSARRGARDLAVARAVGFTRRQVRGVLARQAALVVGAAAAVGVPLGIVAGRSAWGPVAASVQAVDATVVPIRPLVGVVALAAGAGYAVAVARPFTRGPTVPQPSRAGG